MRKRGRQKERVRKVKVNLKNEMWQKTQFSFCACVVIMQYDSETYLYHLWLFASDWPQLSQSCRKKGREHERRPQKFQDGRSQPHPQGLLQEVDGDFEESGGQVDTQLHHVLGASWHGPAHICIV